MRKNLVNIFIFSVSLFVLTALALFGEGVNAETDDITLSTDVQTSLALSLSSNTYPFGNLTAGTPRMGSSGVEIDVTTNASNGYSIGISDGVAGGDSALLHTDTLTRIADATASIASPELWVFGTTKGLGVTVYSADTGKEAKWGTGTTYNDANNKYAGVPETATVIHASTGYKTGSGTTDVAFVVDVEAGQKAGSYSGNAVVTATAVLL